ncbi:MOSC domain-containing protein [Candidatus Pelagibacter sp.]|jgi:MOSC domain-containing protein YiiM|nr:MOSC domain-containing protein [Candidatus Pelagibacter sp.]|tara:strand:- start:45 stop:491 length:447 start_codon:yes stop_codon:yes gene_type:complete
MPEVYKLGISTEHNQSIKEVNSINVLANQGIVGDRHFKEFNNPYNQLSLIESENIDYYNIKYSLNIPYINFRRNIVTKGIQLNDLVGKKILVGNIELEGIDLCRPCRHLTEVLGQDNIIKEFLRRGGLRCQVLSSSSIKIGDQIKILD